MLNICVHPCSSVVKKKDGISADAEICWRIDLDSFTMHPVDTRSGWSLGEKIFQRFEALLLSAGDHLHAAVREIDSAAAKAKLTSYLTRGVTKKDSLHAS